MIADGRKGGRHAREQRMATVIDLGDPAVHGVRRKRDGGAKGIADSLMTNADAEARHRREQDRVARDAKVAEVLRASGPRRNNDIVEAVIFQIIPGKLIVLYDDGFIPVNLRDELKQVERKGIVIINQKSLNHFAPR